MQGLADGYFVIPYTLGGYLASSKFGKVDVQSEAFKSARDAVNERVKRLLSIKGKRTPQEFHRALGKIMWDKVGMGRTAGGLKEAVSEISKLRGEFWKDVSVLGSGEELNMTLERAGRVADFLELGELMARDALHRNESCGGHFREEYQTPDGEAKRDDANFSYAAGWEYAGEGKDPVLNKEPLVFDNCHLAQRSYA